VARGNRALENLAVSKRSWRPARGHPARPGATSDFFPSRSFWRNRRVFVTGHTGFKGGWLTLWLKELGAAVSGYALPPATDPNIFTAVRLADAVTGRFADIRDRDVLAQAIDAADPEIVFHLAAQALVRESYARPIETFEVNVQGTANLLDICRNRRNLMAVAVITSDKCYRNELGARPFAEDDPLGGRDPYSASKACADIVTASFRDAFFSAPGTPGRTAVATARAGNVLGGGDWAKDRIVPDLVRAAAAGRPAAIRQPQAIRPWQHVLDPVAGYLMLAQAACQDGARYSSSFNFAPGPANTATVQTLADGFSGIWKDRLRWTAQAAPDDPPEAATLALNAAKARAILGWRPLVGLPEAIALTAAWYDAHRGGGDMAAFTLEQIRAYSAQALPGIAARAR